MRLFSPMYRTYGFIMRERGHFRFLQPDLLNDRKIGTWFRLMRFIGFVLLASPELKGSLMSPASGFNGYR